MKKTIIFFLLLTLGIALVNCTISDNPQKEDIPRELKSLYEKFPDDRVLRKFGPKWFKTIKVAESEVMDLEDPRVLKQQGNLKQTEEEFKKAVVIHKKITSINKQIIEARGLTGEARETILIRTTSIQDIILFYTSSILPEEKPTPVKNK